MAVPEIVRHRLGDEDVRTRVPLGGDDELVVTPTRTLVYRAEGLLSGESVDEFPHSAERVGVTEGRRKTTIRLDHGIEGESEFTIPSRRADDALPPILQGVLSTAEVTEPDESVLEVYRLGELTILITESRVIKHIGTPVWDDEYEEYAFGDVTDLDVERGDVSSQIIIEVDGRPQRIKTPSEETREIRARIEQALLEFHGAESFAAFRRSVAPDDADDDPAEAEPPEAADDESVETTEDDGASAGMDDSPFGGERRAGGGGMAAIEFDDLEEVGAGPPAESTDVADEIAALRDAVERQNELLEAHGETLEQLIEELRRGR